MNKSLVTNIAAVGLIIIGFITPVYSYQVKTMGLYAFSGAITNWLAIHMLFEKVPFLYGSGIITQRFEDFKIGIKELVMNQFFTAENIQKFVSQSSALPVIDPDLVFLKLKEAVLESQLGPMLNMFGGEAALEPLRPKVAQKLTEIMSELSSSASPGFTENISIIVDKRLDELTPQMVKDIIQQMIRAHLGWLVVWGGVFGAIIGLLSTLI